MLPPASFAARIVMAELQGCGTTERVAEHSDPLHIEPSQEPARRIRRVQLFKLIKSEAHVGAPCPDKLVGELLLLRPAD
jgi:hypothetical protein